MVRCVLVVAQGTDWLQEVCPARQEKWQGQDSQEREER